MNAVFQHAFYRHVYHRSLRYISYKATMAKKNNYLQYSFVCTQKSLAGLIWELFNVENTNFFGE